ncbi:recombinase [Paenibacillus sp. 1011MAR3C5]|uniref:RecT family recombinase n=1 Tax=Paenibacillus sp. 1011MAR3C5 TaxID=1675787 RepID=UPI000E6D3F55|nr:RecT family recombinase [Paenibacillus sp. 1011MAR3C5]RJE88593.1 recombinase [Paenibacillus sp. 1011MAR3C5]
MATEQIISSLEALLEAKHDALPSGFNPTRFVQNCIAYLPEIRNWDRFNAEDLAIQFFKGAVLGLDFLAKECHIIAEGSGVRFQTDYKGEMKLAMKHSVRPLLTIYAKNVREGDCIEEAVIEGRPVINFNPLPFNNSSISGSFAVAQYTDGGMVYETMSAEEIEAVRTNYGKNPGSDTWDKSKGEMYKRTVLRRLCKTIEIDFDAEQRLAFEAGSEFDFSKQPRPQQRSPFEEKEVGPDEVEQG